MKAEVIPIQVSFRKIVNWTYLLIDREMDECLCIDPAWNLEKIKESLEQHGTKLTLILLTHSHVDHVNMAPPLAKEFRCPVYMSDKEVEYYNFTCPHLREIKNNLPISWNDKKIYPLPTPGHTPGSVCYQAGSVLFTGDTLFNEGCGACTAKGSNPRQMFESLQSLKAQISADSLVYPGHSYGSPPGQTFEFLLRNNIYFFINDYKTFYNFRMRPGQTGLMEFK